MNGADLAEHFKAALEGRAPSLPRVAGLDVERRYIIRHHELAALVEAALAQPASSPAGWGVDKREVAAQAALARIKKLRDQYANQAKFADVDEARLFRQFVERLDRAALSQSTSAGRVGE